MSDTLQFRMTQKRDTSINWAVVEATFVPLNGEIIFYTDLNKIKIGNGVKTLSELDFIGGEGGTGPTGPTGPTGSIASLRVLGTGNVLSTVTLNTGTGEMSFTKVQALTSLPTASSSTLGGIKVGGNLSISSGVLKANVKKYATYVIGSSNSGATTSDCDYVWESSKSTVQSLLTQGNARFIFLKGTYSSGTVINVGANTTIIGEGPSTKLFTFYLTLKDGCTIRDVDMIGGNTTSDINTGITVTQANLSEHILIENVQFHQYFRSIYLNSCDGVTISNCLFSQSVVSSYSIPVYGLNIVASGHINVLNNIFRGTGNTDSQRWRAISLSSSSHSIRICGNNIFNSYFGIMIVAGETSETSPRRCTIVDNYIYSDLLGYGIHGSGTTTAQAINGFLIEHNRIKLPSDGTAMQFYTLSESSISDNHIIAPWGLSLYAACRKVTIRGNILLNTNKSIRTESTTGVTGLADYLIVSNNMHSAAISLPTGNNIIDDNNMTITANTQY